MLTFSRYLQIWLAQMRYGLARELMFRANFLLWVVVELVWFVLNLCFIQFLYLKVDVIAGWTRWEMILLVATNNVIQQLFQTFLMINCMKLPELIRTGKLDFFLAQPASVQFLVSTRHFEPGSILNGLLAGGVCLYAALHLGTPVTVSGLLLFPLLLLLGVLIHYSLLMMLMSLCFWITRAQGMVNAYYQVFQIARLPREAFSGLARLFFTWAVPLLLIANVPARTLIHGWKPVDLLTLVLVTAFLFWLSRKFFQLGLRQYGSASS